MSRAGRDESTGRVPWRERRPAGWDGTGRMSLNEWWDDLLAPTWSILLARVFIVVVAGFVALQAPPVTVVVGLALLVVALGLRLRGQAPRVRPPASGQPSPR